MNRLRARIACLLAVAGIFSAVTLINHEALDDPPAWDAAMSIHPAAIWLSSHEFRLGELLKQPDYLQGGPNVHSLSIVTWFTALGYWSLGDMSWLFPAMHLCHFFIWAIALWGVYRFAAPVLGCRLAGLVAAAVFAFPTVRAQTTCLYLEVPLLATTQWALIACSQRRFFTAAIYVLACFYIKPTGMILAGALAAAALLEAAGWKRRLLWAAVLAGPSIAAFLFNSWLYRQPNATAYEPPGYVEYLSDNLAGRIRQVPDLCALTVLTLFVIALRWRLVFQAFRSPVEPISATEPSVAQRSLRLACLMPAAFVGFFLIAGRIEECYLLPRYFVQIIPCMFVVLVSELRSHTGPRTAAAVVVLFIALFVLNERGAFYPRNTANDGSVAERSLEYRDLLSVQRQGAKAIEALAYAASAFYGYPEQYLFGYPEMGFVSRRLPDGHCIGIERPYSRAQLADFPSHFFVVVDYGSLGGQQIRAVIGKALDSGWTCRPRAEFVSGDYRLLIVEISAPARPATELAE